MAPSSDSFRNIGHLDEGISYYTPYPRQDIEDSYCHQQLPHLAVSGKQGSIAIRREKEKEDG